MKNILIVASLLSCSLFTSAQTTIQGTLSDAANGEPLSGATVYLAELNKGTTTNSNGMFHLAGIGPGRYRLVVSFLGYQDEIRELLVSEDGQPVSVEVAMTPEPIRINEVVVSSAYVSSRRENAYPVEVVDMDGMQRSGAVTVMDMIEGVPGVDAVTTGPAVSRPQIRGLSGNRVLTVVDGARFETQQWDEEHGIGVNELGVGRIEVIKGPASLLYGPEAMGGVIHFVPEPPPAVNTRVGDATAALYSNNLGFYGKVDVRAAKEHFNWGFNALGRLLSDYYYNDYEYRVPNTRLLEYGGKGYAGINGQWGSSKLSYSFNKADYGILDAKDLEENDNGGVANMEEEKEKFPFETEAPFHEVTDHRLHLKTTFLTGASKIETLLGYQNNHRSENEELSGSKKGYTYLDMLLQTATYDLKWYLPKWEHFETILGVQGMLQKNRNREGAATQLIPDARINDLGFLALTRYALENLTASFGARYDTRHLDTDEAMGNGLNMPAITRNYNNISASIGLSYRYSELLEVKASYASGYRSPNLNELLSNGVKLESGRYERGNTDFKKETNQEGDLSLNLTLKDITFEISGFYNKINDFIYIAPTGNTVPGNIDPSEMYPEYQYLQSDAEIRGGEAGLTIHPVVLPWLLFESKASTLKGTRNDDDSYLPMMPATKISNTFYFKWPEAGRLKNLFFSLGSATALKQSQVALAEEETPAYTLLNAGMGATFRGAEFSLTARNLLDKTYLDHLSRFREFDIPEPGLNVSLSVKIPLNSLL